jgi:quercetin dioxygenase-like cupin family protein
MVNSLPVVVVEADRSIPYGTSTTLNATVTGDGPFTYSWTPSALLVSAVVEDPTTVNLTSMNTFTLTAGSQVTGCTASDAVTITITGGALEVTASATPDEICTGSSVQLNAVASGGSEDYDYSWTSDPVSTISAISNPVVSPTVTTIYYVEVDDGFNTVNDQVTVTVNALPTVSITGSSSICIGSTTTLSPATGGTWVSNSPAVASVSAGGTVTGLTAGTSTFTFTETATGCSSTTGTVTVTSCTKTLTLTSVFLEGLYNGSGTLRQAYDEYGPHWPAGVADHINVELHSSPGYSTIIYTATEVELSTGGTAAITIPAGYSASYYITVRHRNHIETTTALPVSFINATITYAFDAPAKAFGSNLKLIDEAVDHYVIYGADVTQDGFVDSGDYPDVVNDNFNYVTGYLPTDINGDGFIDSGDYPIMVNNNYNYVSVILP